MVDLAGQPGTSRGTEQSGLSSADLSAVEAAPRTKHPEQKTNDGCQKDSFHVQAR